MERGLRMFKMKIGRNKEEDLHRIKYAGAVIGENNLLFIEANGAYFPGEAIKGNSKSLISPGLRSRYPRMIWKY